MVDFFSDIMGTQHTHSLCRNRRADDRNQRTATNWVILSTWLFGASSTGNAPRLGVSMQDNIFMPCTHSHRYVHMPLLSPYSTCASPRLPTNKPLPFMKPFTTAIHTQSQSRHFYSKALLFPGRVGDQEHCPYL